MELQKNALLKIIIFLIVGCLFVVGMLAYSSARTDRGGRFVEHFDERTWGPGERWSEIDSDEIQRRVERSFDVRPGGTLTIDADEGAITISSWEKPVVAVVVEMSGDERELRRYNLEFDSSDSTVIIVAKRKRYRFFPWRWQSYDIHFQVTVPANFHAKVSTSGGDVEIDGLEGRIRSETSGGDLRLTSLTGDVYGITSGGDVIVRRVKGSLEAHTSGGDVEVDSIVGSVKVGTSGGDLFLIDVNGKIYGETSGGNIEARIIGENQGVHLETSGGNITVHLPAAFAGDLEAVTSGGSVECDLPVMVTGKVRTNELRGKINGGGYPIHLSTSGGNIYVRGG